MKQFSLRIVLFLICLGIAILVAIAAAVYSGRSGEVNRDFVVFCFLISFASTVVLLLVMNTVVFSPIKKLHETVRSFRGATDQYADFQPANEIDQLNLEIIAWADDRKNEIERLKKLEMYRKEFLGNVSHELKTPIFNIQGYVLTLLDGGLEDETINRDYLQRAERSIDRMITIIDDLEAISQLETGELQIEPEKFDIVNLTREVTEAQELKATTKGIILTLLDADKPVYVYADRFRIRQVMVNLIVNSIKYGKEYGETKIRISESGDQVMVEVADNGIGIGKEHLPRLFERFYRVDKSRSREMGGTGLGLAIVKHIIEAHNQQINVMSTEESGTVFTFYLKKG